MAERFRSKLPRARIELIKEANHPVFIDQTEQVADLLRAFLQDAVNG